MKRVKYRHLMSYPVAVKSIILVVLFLGVFSSSFKVMIQWWAREDYSYCYLIPFIVLYLLWEKKTEFFNTPSIPDWKGMILFSVGIGFFWLGELGGEYYITYLSSWLLLVGGCILQFGIKKGRVILFPLMMILTMFPLPNFFNFRISLALKMVSSKLGVGMMQAAGMSAFREGNVIDLGFTQLQVVDACSGLRYLYPMIVLSVIVAYFYKSGMVRKFIIVLSSIPLIIFTNSLRIALTGILSLRYGAKAVDGFFHDFEGWLIFMLTLGMLCFEIWLLNRFFGQKKSEQTDSNQSKRSDQTPVDPAPPGGEKQWVFSSHYTVSVIVLAATLLLSQNIEFRESVPLIRSFDEFPLRVGKWNGQRQTMGEKFINELDFTDYMILDYTNDSNQGINFYVAYYDSQRKGESIHSPSSCFRGGGWVFDQAGKSKISLDNGPFHVWVNRALIRKNSQQQIAYYWFPCRNRNLTNAFEMKWYNFWDALTRQRTDGALVRMIATVYPDETVKDAEIRLQSFVKEVFPILSQFLPR